MAIDPDKIDGISITNNEEKIELRKRNGRWELDAPVKDRADDAAVQQLLTGRAETLKKETSLEGANGKDDVRDLGLVKPNVTLQLKGQDAPPADSLWQGYGHRGQGIHPPGQCQRGLCGGERLAEPGHEKAADFPRPPPLGYQRRRR